MEIIYLIPFLIFATIMLAFANYDNDMNRLDDAIKEFERRIK